MVKGFSDNEVKNNTQNTQIKEKKGLAGFLKGKKFTYTLPGKKQINIFGSIVIGLNICLLYTSPSPRDQEASRMPSSA